MDTTKRRGSTCILCIACMHACMHSRNQHMHGKVHRVVQGLCNLPCCTCPCMLTVHHVLNGCMHHQLIISDNAFNGYIDLDWQLNMLSPPPLRL